MWGEETGWCVCLKEEEFNASACKNEHLSAQIVGLAQSVTVKTKTFPIKVASSEYCQVAYIWTTGPG